jgi:hypothetical protein
LGLQELDLSGMTQGFSAPQINKSFSGNLLSIGGRFFGKGLGMHSPAEVAYPRGPIPDEDDPFGIVESCRRAS